MYFLAKFKSLYCGTVITWSSIFHEYSSYMSALNRQNVKQKNAHYVYITPLWHSFSPPNINRDYTQLIIQNNICRFLCKIKKNQLCLNIIKTPIAFLRKKILSQIDIKSLSDYDERSYTKFVASLLINFVYLCLRTLM